MEALLRPELQAGLRLSDFTQDPETGVHMAPGTATPAGYLDGAEQVLLQGLPALGDRGIGSDELRALMRDWATVYHLSPYRATLLDCLGLARAGDASVLELGAGCGAITRWLGEHFSTVDAVEGSASRARVALARCADLESVTVYSGNYSELAEQGRYDVTTLIGVLEYSHLYHPEHAGDPTAAALANLGVARRALTDDGVLLIAVENRLGLKYLNGAREDHSGRLFEGIEGYVHPGTPVTWPARELERMILQAGFHSAQFLLPFPDYKLTRTIINPELATDDHHVDAWLMGVAPDRGRQRGPLLFNESLAIGEITRAGLLRELSNSFLVVAYAGEPDDAQARLGIDTGWVARHYSLDRRAGLRKRATLRGTVVEHEPSPFGDAEQEQTRRAVEAAGLRFTPANEPHHRGELLSAGVLRTALRSGFGESFLTHIAEHREFLLERFGTGSGTQVSGAAWDATWWNVVVDAETGQWRVIDTEWELTRPVPVDYVLWRMLGHFFANHLSEMPAPLRQVDPAAAVSQLLRAAGCELDEDAELAFSELEHALQELVGPRPVTVRVQHALDAVEALGRRRVVLAAAEEVASAPSLLATYARVVSAADPVTLVLYAPDADPAVLGPRIEAAMGAAGLGDDSPDLLLLPVERDADTERALAADAVALLSDLPASPPFDALPRVGGADVAELRRLLSSPSAPSGTAPAAIADAADRIAGGRNVVELVGAGEPSRAGWVACDPATVSPRDLLALLDGNVVVSRVAPKSLRKDDCLRTVLEIAVDCANTMVLYAPEVATLRASLRTLGFEGAAVSERAGYAVAAVRTVPAAA